MGVGTYRDDFHKSGRSINVDSSMTKDEDYDAYVKEEAEAGEEPLDRADWDQRQYDDDNESMIDAVEAVCREVGMHSDRDGRFGGGRVDFSKEFTSIADGDVFTVGWRSWESDFVVAVGPTRGFGDIAMYPEDNAAEVIRERGMSPKAFKAAYDAVLGEFEELLRLSLMAEGHQTARPTGSYTSQRDKPAENAEARIAELVASVTKGIASLAGPADRAVAGVEERLELAKAILELDERDREDIPPVLVATYAGGGAALYDPRGEEGEGLVVSASVPREMRSHMASLPVIDELAPIPHDAATAAWYASIQRRNVVISPEQFSAITGEDCVIAWHDSETNEGGRIRLHEATPAPAPGM